MIHAFLNLDKPAGITAHDCVSQVRKLTCQKRVGHSGTLDPAATGVLPIALGQTTRLLRFLPEGKAYHAKVRFGLTTATDDLEGEIITMQPCPNLNLSDIKTLLPLFLGQIQQRPPAFSAIQVNGVRLYDLARAGKIVEAPIRTVNVMDIKILAWQSGDFPELDLAIACGSGTYIRAIARDLGAKLGCGATLAGLVRTYSNGFNLAQSLRFENLKALESIDSVLIDPDTALQHLKAISLPSEAAKRWTHGQIINLENINLDQETSLFIEFMESAELFDCRVYENNGKFWGIGQIEGLNLKPVVVLNQE